MSENTRIVINAGGRVFETSTTTLKLSGAGYFEALLGDTGTQMRGKKRARPGDDAPEVTGSAEDDAPSAPREIFIDRDPDVFADVLMGRALDGEAIAAAATAVADSIAPIDDVRATAEYRRVARNRFLKRRVARRSSIRRDSHTFYSKQPRTRTRPHRCIREKYLEN